MIFYLLNVASRLDIYYLSLPISFSGSMSAKSKLSYGREDTYSTDLNFALNDAFRANMVKAIPFLTVDFESYFSHV